MNIKITGTSYNIFSREE